MKHKKRTSIIMNYGMGTGFVLMILGSILGEAETSLIRIGGWVVVLSFVAGLLNEKYGKEKKHAQ